MPRRFIVVFLACLSLPTWATNCLEHNAGGTAPAIAKASLKSKTQEVCFRAYVVMHSGVSRTPLWSTERLLRANVEAAQTLARRDRFHPEPSLSIGDRAELTDYARSGLDRGHMAPQ